MFAKNIFKKQPAELHTLQNLGNSFLMPSTREALSAELVRLNENAEAEATGLLEKATLPAEIPFPVTNKTKN